MPKRGSTSGPGAVVVVEPGSCELTAHEAGGKGAALARMITAGLPVPPTAIVPSTVGSVAEDRLGLRETLAGQVTGPAPLSDAAVDALFVGAVDEGLRRALASALDRLGPDAEYAVRSSATAEDLATASFAGQYRSVLSVRGVDALVAAVESVWASLWHRAPVAYRRLAGVGDDVAMAVIVQRMVDAQRAGVAFSVDPAGEEGSVRVEHVEGLGESLVSGERTPTIQFVERASLPASTDTVDGVVRSAAALALRAEELFETPQDTEWAFDGATTWLVQSRPITTGSGTVAVVTDPAVDGSVRPDGRYTTSGIAETLPGVLDDLVWTTAGFLLDHALIESVAALGSTALPDEAHSFIVRIRGRSALDLDRMAQVASDLPGGSPEQLEAELLGLDVAVAAVVERPTSMSDRFRSARHDLRLVRATRTCRREESIVVATIDRLIARPPDTTLGDDALLSMRARVVDLALRASVAEVSIAMAAVAAHGRLLSQLTRSLGHPGALEWVERIIGGAGSPARLRRPLEAASALRARGVDPRAVERWDDLRALDEATEPGAVSLVEIVTDAARRAGCRSVVAGTTWASDLAGFWQLVRHATNETSRSVGDLDDDIRRLGDELASTPGWTRTRWLTGQVIDVRRRIVGRLARDAVDLLDRRERCKAAVLELGGVIRILDDEIGRRLAERGRLIDAEDVRHLSVAELRPMLSGTAPVDQARVLARRRTAERWRTEPGLPRGFTGAESVPTVLDDSPVALGPESDLAGWPASPGRHIGPARVLAEPDVESVDVGDVVVARRTDAAWLPVFLRAGAIVVEEGGPLSHASILARELGLPAVVNVPGVVDRLGGGRHRVAVDGARGTISIVEQVDQVPLEPDR